MYQERPHPPGIFVRQRYRGYILVASADELLKPAIGPVKLAFGHSDHCPRAVDQQGPQITIAALADAQQGRLATTRMLPGCQPQPGRSLPSILKILGIPHRGHQGTGGKRADPRNFRSLPARGVLPVPALNLRLQFVQVPVQLFQMLTQSLQQLTKNPG